MVVATRRSVLQVGAGGLLAASAWPARAAAQIIVADPGGPFSSGFRKAFYDPFERETGIRVINVARQTQPLAQFKLMVETKAYVWDVCHMNRALALNVEQAGLAEQHGAKFSELSGLMEGAFTSSWIGTNIFSTVVAFQKRKFAGNEPRSWSDFWNAQKFPGRRALGRAPMPLLEIALLADGVGPAQLYPFDVERAFKSLDRIKPHIAVWWSSGAESTQLLQSGDIDLTGIWSARAQAAIDGGASAGIVRNQALITAEGFTIPKGTPNAEAARQFVKFCARADRQAAYTDDLAYGPTNLKAFEYIRPERAALLPTSPENISSAIPVSDEWWVKNLEKMQARLTEWLLI